MAKTNPRELFVTAFRAYNLNRYKDSRVDKPRFQMLQMSELAFGELTVVEATQTGTFATITSASRKFNAVDQSYIKAKIDDVGISTVQSTSYPYEDITTMKALSQPGLIAYMNDDLTQVLTAVVFSEANAGTEADVLLEAQSIITLACNYEIPIEEITLATTEDPKIWTVKIDNEIIYGEIIAVRSEVPTLDIPVTDYGKLAEPMVPPNPYPPVQPQ